MPEQKHIKMEGDSLKAARTFVNMLDQNRQEMEKIHEEFYKRRIFLAEAHIAAARECWNAVVEPHGIDPQESWTLGTWRLDATYLETHDLTFLCEHDPLPEPMQNVTFDAPDTRTVN